MTGGQLIADDEIADVGMELEEAETVGDGGPAASQAARQLLVGVATREDQFLVGFGLFDRVELDADDVLDQGVFTASRGR